jgi:NADPH-dependent curcumin reductase CurA
MSNPSNAAWHLHSRPSGRPSAAHFQWRQSPLPELADGDVRVRNIYLSIDPTNRIWMNDADSYLPKLALGQVMRGIAIGKVEESRHPGLATGDVVQGMLGWQQYWTGNGKALTKLPPIPLPLTAHFGLLGHIGLTAYFGLLDVGQAKPGETLVVSAAAGAVGSIAAQIGKAIGMKVVGIAGGPEKCRWLLEDLALDGAIDYKNENVSEALRRLCPEGIDVDFENVGGKTLDAVLAQLRLHGRVVLCGLISQYNAAQPEPLYNTGNLLIQRGRMEGLIVLDFLGRAAEGIGRLLAWHSEGKLKYRLDITEGLENAPAALGKLFDGANQGKMLVRISTE